MPLEQKKPRVYPLLTGTGEAETISTDGPGTRQSSENFFWPPINRPTTIQIMNPSSGIIKSFMKGGDSHENRSLMLPVSSGSENEISTLQTNIQGGKLP